MDMLDAIRERHSVRTYLSHPIEETKLAQPQDAIDASTDASGLDIQLVTDNPEVFGLVGRTGFVRGAMTSIVFVAEGTEDDEAIGFWGQRIVLEAQMMGLNTCWLAFCSRKKSNAVVAPGKRIRIVVAVGYGATQGKPHPSKPLDRLCTWEGTGEMPQWFATAVEAAQLAPTAMNNQRFHLTLRADGKTVAATAPAGGWNIVDLGIVKRTFKEAADRTRAAWRWES